MQMTKRCLNEVSALSDHLREQVYIHPPSIASQRKVGEEGKKLFNIETRKGSVVASSMERLEELVHSYLDIKEGSESISNGTGSGGQERNGG